MLHRKICFPLGFALLIFILQATDRVASEKKLGVFSDNRTSYYYSEPDQFCKSPCFLDLDTNNLFIFISEKTIPIGESGEKRMDIDLGIVHNPDSSQTFGLDSLERKTPPQFGYMILSRNGDYSVVLDTETLEKQEIWTNTANEKIAGFMISPNRSHSLFKLEMINSKDEFANPERKIYLRRFSGQNQAVNDLIPLSTPPGLMGTIQSFSRDSDWFLIQYNDAKVVPPKYEAPTFYRVIKSSNPDIYFDIGYDEKFAYCMWNHFYPWLFCASDSDYSVYELKEDKIEHFSYPRNTFPPVIKIFSVDWIDRFLHFDSVADDDENAEDFELYDIETGQLAHKFKGENLFFYSPTEDLLITSEVMRNENFTFVYKLYFYRGFIFEGEKELFSSYRINYYFGDQFVDKLEGLYSFILNFDGPRITEDDLLVEVNLTYDPELEYSLVGDFIRVLTPSVLFEEKLNNKPIRIFYDQYLEEKMTRDQRSPDSIRLNSITDYYFFPKPEVQE